MAICCAMLLLLLLGLVLGGVITPPRVLLLLWRAAGLHYPFRWVCGSWVLSAPSWAPLLSALFLHCGAQGDLEGARGGVITSPLAAAWAHCAAVLLFRGRLPYI